MKKYGCLPGYRKRAQVQGERVTAGWESLEIGKGLNTVASAQQLEVVVHCCPSTWEAWAGRTWVPGYPGLHSETLFPKWRLSAQQLWALDTVSIPHVLLTRRLQLTSLGFFYSRHTKKRTLQQIRSNDSRHQELVRAFVKLSAKLGFDTVSIARPHIKSKGK